jgi:hypothetical protein
VKRLFLLSGVLFLLFEPFAVHSGLFVKAFGSQICPGCGMKDVCGPVCCCVGSENCGSVEGTDGSSLRSVNCAPDRPALATSFSDMAKLLPVRPAAPFRVERLSSLCLKKAFIPSFISSPVSPPPESAILS